MGTRGDRTRERPAAGRRSHQLSGHRARGREGGEPGPSAHRKPWGLHVKTVCGKIDCISFRLAAAEGIFLADFQSSPALSEPN